VSGDRPPAVVIDHVAKRFADVVALEDVSLDVAPGELFGFIGPDGAGKTTLFRILVTVMLPDAGTARVLGLDTRRDWRALRRRVGYMPGRFSLYPDLSVEENLRFFASVFGTTLEHEYQQIAPIYRQLEPFRERAARALSGGMKQKLALCCALVHRPDILFLDEPTTGVDSVSRVEFWELLARLQADGLTVLVSTPYMDEAARCDRIALMQKGRLLAIDTPQAVAAAFGRRLFGIRSGQRYRVLTALRQFPHVGSVYPFGDELHYTDARTDVADADVRRDVAEFLAGRGLDAASIEPIAPGVEDTFIARMSETAEARG
jgi:ABC-type multidrug transport system ATPase subunit